MLNSAQGRIDAEMRNRFCWEDEGGGVRRTRKGIGGLVVIETIQGRAVAVLVEYGGAAHGTVEDVVDITLLTARGLRGMPRLDGNRPCPARSTSVESGGGAVMKGKPCVLPALLVAGARVAPQVPFPPPAHRTGRADLPQPALGPRMHAHAHDGSTRGFRCSRSRPSVSCRERSP